MAQHAKLVITINGKEVENTLKGVGAEIGRLRSDLRGLNEADPEFKTKAAELRKARERYAEINREIKGLPKLMKAASNSFEAQKKKVAQLRKELEKSSTTSEDYKKKVSEYRTEMKKLDDLNTQMTGKPTFWQKIAGQAEMFTAIATGIFTFNTIASKFRELVNVSIELSKAQTDVQKATGMTRKEVGGLTEELKALDTATSTIDLMKIAEQAGRFGVAKENIASFVAEMDKANVVLGEQMGGVEGLTTTLAELKKGYKELDDQSPEDSINKVYSAINALSTGSIATEKNIASFAVRLGNLPSSLRPSIAEALSLGAAFEQSGIDATRASRAYGSLLENAVKDTEPFARLMNRSKDEVLALINTNPTEFFLQFSKALKEADKQGTSTLNIFKELGLSSNTFKRVFGAAADGADEFRAVLEKGNNAMEEGLSLTEDYNVVNDSLANSVERLKKHFVELMESDRVVDFVKGLVNWFSRLVGVTDKNDKQLSRFGETMLFLVKTFGVIIATMVSYNAAMKLSTLLTKQKTQATLLENIVNKQAALLQRIYTGTLLLSAAAKNFFTGNTRKAAIAMRAFNIAVRSNPLGLLLTLLGAVTSAIIIFRNNTKRAANEQKSFSTAIQEAHSKADKSIAGTVGQISNLITVIKDEKISLDTRKKAYQELIRIAPEFNGLLKDEKFNIERLTEVYISYIDQLKGVARAKAMANLAQDAATDVVNADFALSQTEKQLALERERLKTIKQYAETQELHDGIWVTVEKETRAYKNQVKIIEELEDAQKSQTNALAEAEKLQEDILEHNKDKVVAIQEEIEWVEVLIDTYSQFTDEASQSYLQLQKIRLDGLKKELQALTQIDNLNNNNDGGSVGGGSGGGDGSREVERRQKIADELVKIEIRKNRQLRDERLKTREEEAELMEEGFRKDVELLNIQTEKRKNTLRDELEDLKILREEYRKKAEEELAKGNTEGADGYLEQADDLKKIMLEKNKTFQYIEQTHQLALQKLKVDNYRKLNEEDRKQHERELKNLETKHNNELKAVDDLEKAKQILRDEYGYSDNELQKIKSFEAAKSKIVLEQQKETYNTQVAFIEQKIEELQGSLDLDDALEHTIIGRIFSAEEREQMLEDLEMMQNILSKLDDPDAEGGKGGNDGMQKQALSFIDLFGFSGQQWQEAFDNLDTLEGKLAFAKMAVQALSNAFSQYYEIQRQNMQRDLESFSNATNRKKSELEKQLQEGYITQEFYNAKVEKLDAELEQKRAEMEYKSAMQKWKASIIEANVNTALGITSALSMGAPGIVLAAVIGALGLFQIGLISANKPKKPQGYFDGGESGGSGRYDSYGRELADGPLHAREYVIPEWLRRDPQIAQMEEFIEARRRGGSPADIPPVGYADGGATRPENDPTNPSPDFAFPPELLGVLIRINETLEELRDNPIEAKLTRTMEVAKNMSDDITDYNNHRNKNKR